jgi:hypothetical protein
MDGNHLVGAASFGMLLESLTLDDALWQHWLGQSDAADTAQVDYTSAGSADSGAPCVS